MPDSGNRRSGPVATRWLSVGSESYAKGGSQSISEQLGQKTSGKQGFCRDSREVHLCGPLGSCFRSFAQERHSVNPRLLELCRNTAPPKRCWCHSRNDLQRTSSSPSTMTRAPEAERSRAESLAAGILSRLQVRILERRVSRLEVLTPGSYSYVYLPSPKEAPSAVRPNVSISRPCVSWCEVHISQRVPSGP